jgi:hypothetical protein
MRCAIPVFSTVILASALVFSAVGGDEKAPEQKTAAKKSSSEAKSAESKKEDKGAKTAKPAEKTTSKDTKTSATPKKKPADEKSAKTAEEPAKAKASAEPKPKKKAASSGKSTDKKATEKSQTPTKTTVGTSAKPKTKKPAAGPSSTKRTTSASAAAFSPASDDVEIARSVVCTGIAEREPEGAATSFPAAVGKLYFFTNVKGVQDTLEIVHKWYQGDVLRSSIPLKVKSPNWRTYSSRTIDPSWTGAWRIDVINGETGDVLSSSTFTLE